MNENVLKLIYIYSDLVLYTQEIILSSEQFIYEEVSDSYKQIINNINNNLKKNDLEKYSRTILMAYIAWIDEQIMLSNLSFKKQWMKNLLQKEYFQTSNLGTEFFIHYNNFEKQYVNEKLVYLYVLCLGFKGKYLIDKTQLNKFIEQELKANSMNIDIDYFNQTYDLSAPSIKPIKKIQFFKLNYLVFMVIVSLLFILNMHFSLNNELDTLFSSFENIK